MDSVRRQDYSAYISSPQWRAVRERAFRKYGRKCAGCGATELLHVHHKTYQRFRRERLTDLVIVCETCHSVIHDIHQNRNPNSLDLWKVTGLVLAILRAENGVSHTPNGWVPANRRSDHRDPLAREHDSRRQSEGFHNKKRRGKQRELRSHIEAVRRGEPYTPKLSGRRAADVSSLELDRMKMELNYTDSKTPMVFEPLRVPFDEL